MGLDKQIDTKEGQSETAAMIFKRVLSTMPKEKSLSPKEYIKAFWESYLSIEKSNALTPQNMKRIDNQIFRYILAAVLIKNDIFPIYRNSKLAFVPNIRYDLLLYTTDRGPVCLSAKTSFRERYKQADLEAIAMKYAYGRSLSF